MRKDKEHEISRISLKSGLNKGKIIDELENIKLLDLTYNIQH
jgi:hypothetical protein